MIKVAYCLRKENDFSYKKSGIGFISDSGEDLILYPNSKWERIIEYCIPYCHPILYKQGEYKGSFTECKEVDFVVKGSIERKEIEITYKLWYKIL